MNFLWFIIYCLKAVTTWLTLCNTSMESWRSSAEALTHLSPTNIYHLRITHCPIICSANLRHLTHKGVTLSQLGLLSAAPYIVVICNLHSHMLSSATVHLSVWGQQACEVMFMIHAHTSFATCKGMDTAIRSKTDTKQKQYWEAMTSHIPPYILDKQNQFQSSCAFTCNR